MTIATVKKHVPHATSSVSIWIMSKTPWFNLAVKPWLEADPAMLLDSKDKSITEEILTQGIGHGIPESLMRREELYWITICGNTDSMEQHTFVRTAEGLCLTYFVLNTSAISTVFIGWPCRAQITTQTFLNLEAGSTITYCQLVTGRTEIGCSRYWNAYKEENPRSPKSLGHTAYFSRLELYNVYIADITN